MLVRIANREDPDKTVSEIWIVAQFVLACLVGNKCSIFRTFTVQGNSLANAHQRKTNGSSSDSLQLSPFSKWEHLF